MFVGACFETHFSCGIWAHFLPADGQKTGLSAPIFFAALPQKRISAAIPCAAAAQGLFEEFLWLIQ
jgi:hypothetical protein